MIPELINSGHRVIVPDMLGYGNSDNPKGYEIYAEQEHAKRIIELMDYLGVETWTHIMHDAGGIWTWELLKENSKRVSKLIILNTIIFKEGFVPPVKMKEGNMAKFSMWLYQKKWSNHFLMKQLFKATLKENTLSKDEIKGYKTPLLNGRTKAMYYFFTNTCSNLPQYDSLLQSLDIPCQIIWGKHDKMLLLTPQKKKIISALKIQEQDIHIIDAKHFIQEEAPKEINKLILEFINK